MQYSIVGTFSGIPGFPDGISDEPCHLDDIIRESDAFKGLSVDKTEPGETEYGYLAEEHDGDGDSFWEQWGREAIDVRVSGVLSEDEFRAWVDMLGAFPEDCETMGTLGGPLNPCGIVADISFRMECRFLIESIRVTPFYGDKRDRLDALPGMEEQTAERVWQTLRAETFERFGA